MQRWFAVPSSTCGVSLFHPFLGHHEVRSPGTSNGIEAVQGKTKKGKPVVTSKIAGCARSSLVFGVAFLLCDAEATQVGGIRSDG
jgi:hypothetical protein